MNTTLSIYTAYFLVSLAMTIWVARTQPPITSINSEIGVPIR